MQLFPLLLNKFTTQKRDYLVDLIETSHLQLKLLEKFAATQKNMTISSRPRATLVDDEPSDGTLPSRLASLEWD